MKTTIDLPPDLVRALKIRAVNEGRKLKELAADLLHRGLAEHGGPPTTKPLKVRVEKQADGLPVVLCSANAPARRMSAGDLLALEQQTLNQEDLRRLGHAL
jgi:plasmid stability protein